MAVDFPYKSIKVKRAQKGFWPSSPRSKLAHSESSGVLAAGMYVVWVKCVTHDVSHTSPEDTCALNIITGGIESILRTLTLRSKESISPNRGHYFSTSSVNEVLTAGRDGRPSARYLRSLYTT